MDFNAFNQNPMLKKGMKKITLFISLFALLEIGAFIGVSYWIGFSYAFWITVLFIIIGYVIRPVQSQSSNHPLKSFSPRRIASTLLMIPGFITDIIAVLVLIGPIRRFLTKKIMSRLLPSSMSNMLNGDLFSNLNRQMNLDGMNPDFSHFDDFKSKKQRKKERRNQKDQRNQTDEVIDVDYEVEVAPGRFTSTHNLDIDHPDQYRPKALEEEVIDVEYEWEEK